MEQDTSSSWKARTALLGAYLIYAGIFWACASSSSSFAGFFATCLLFLMWLPYMMYRRRKEWLDWLPIYVTAIVAVPLCVFMIGYVGLPYGSEDFAIRVLGILLAGIFTSVNRACEDSQLQREEARTAALKEERRKAPKHRPTMKFAGVPRKSET